MPGITKIATCCYCGTRAALVISHESRQHLSCGSCGAPLSEMKQIKREAAPVPTRLKAPAAKGTQRSKKKGRPSDFRRSRRRYRKGMFERFFEEVVDEIEDLFD